MKLAYKTITLTISLNLLAFSLAFSCLSAERGKQSAAIGQGLHLWSDPVTNMEFVWLEGGCFKMGQNGKENRQLKKEAGIVKYKKFYSDEGPQHKVCLEGFWLGRYEVTRHQWFELMGSVPFPGGMGNDHPATNISWEMANKFIKNLNSKNKQTTFRLPTEAEIEYATRAGTETPFYTGMTISTDEANFNGHYIFGDGLRGVYHEKPMRVGSYEPNAFGLFDMHGNVWEWCSDWYGSHYYGASPVDSPQGPAVGSLKVMRGGSWYTSPRSLRSANRHSVATNIALEDYGIRLVANHLPPGNKTNKTITFDPDF